MRENLNAIKRLVAFTLTVLLLGTTIWNDVFVIATEENHCSEYVDEQTYAARILQPVGEGDGYCDHCGQVEQSHIHEVEEPAEEVVAAEETQPVEEVLGDAAGDTSVPADPQPASDNPEEAVPNPDNEEGISQEDTPVIDDENSEETPEEDIEDPDKKEEDEEDKEEEDCEHEWVYTSNGDGTHVKKCSKCDEESTEECTFDEDGKCIYCGYEKESLIYQTYSKTLYGTTVTVSGQMPKDAWVEIYYAGVKPIENIINRETEEEVEALVAFDINIYRSSGEKYQPKDDGGSVSVSFAGVEEVEGLSEEEVSVYRIEDDNETVTEIECEVDGEEVKFEADHFSTYATVIDNPTLSNPTVQKLESYEEFAYINTTGTNEYTSLDNVKFYVYFPRRSTIKFEIKSFKNLKSPTNPSEGDELYPTDTISVTGEAGEYKEVYIDYPETTSSAYMTAGKYYSVVVSVIDEMSCYVVCGAGDLKTYIKGINGDWENKYDGIFQDEHVINTAPTDTGVAIASIKDKDGNELLKSNTSYMYYYAVGDADTFTATLEPDVERAINWTVTSTDGAVEKVSSDANTVNIKAVKNGTATVTATYGDSTRTINISVLDFKVGSDSIIDGYTTNYTGSVIHPDVKGYITSGTPDTNLAVTFDQDASGYTDVNDDAKIYLTYTSSIDPTYKKHWEKSFEILPLELTEDVFPAATLKFTVVSGEIRTMEGLAKVNNVLPVFDKDFSATIESTRVGASGLVYTLAIEGRNNFTGNFTIDRTNTAGSTDINDILRVQPNGNALSNVTYTGKDFILSDKMDNSNIVGWDKVEFIGNDDKTVWGIVTKETADVTITDVNSGVSATLETGSDNYTSNGNNAAKDVGMKRLTFSMKDGTGYTGSLSLTFTIKPADISGAEIQWKDTNKKFKHKVNNEQVKPNPGDDITASDTDFVVNFNGSPIKVDQYDPSYSNNTKITTNARVTLTGKGNFTGELTDTFNIVPDFEKDVVVMLVDGGEYQATNANEYNFTTAGYTRLYDPNLVGSTGITTINNAVSVQVPSNTGAQTALVSTDYTLTVYDEGSSSLTANVGTKVVKITPSAAIIENYNLALDYVIEAKFDVVPRSIDSSAISVSYTAPTGRTYNGQEHTIVPATTHDQSGANLELYYTVKAYTLQPGTDYEIKYNGTNVNAGTAKFTITGKGNFTDTISASKYKFTIGKLSLKDSSVTVEMPASSYTYDGTAKEPVPTVKINGNPIEEFADTAKTIRNYKLSYDNNINASTNTKKATLTITAGTNGNDGQNLKDSIVKDFVILSQAAEITEIKIGGENGSIATLKNNSTDPKIYACDSLAVNYDGSIYKGMPVVKVRYGASTKTLDRNTDYVVTYTDDPSVRGYNDTSFSSVTEALKAPYIRISGRGNYFGTNAIVLYKIQPIIIEENDSKLVANYTKKYDYTGSAIDFVLTSVTYNGVTLTKGTDYDVIEPTDKTTAGEKNAELHFKGSYAYKSIENTENYPLRYTVGIDINDPTTEILLQNPFNTSDTNYCKSTSSGYSVRWINGYAPIVNLTFTKANGSNTVTVNYDGKNGTEEPVSNTTDLTFSDVASNTTIKKYDSRPSKGTGEFNKITLTITPKANTQFYGEPRVITYDIAPIDLADSSINWTTGTIGSYQYTGDVITPNVKIVYTYGTSLSDKYNLNTRIDSTTGEEVATDSDFKLDIATIGPNAAGQIFRYAIGYGNFTGNTSDMAFTITKGDVSLWLKPSGGSEVELKPLGAVSGSDNQTFTITTEETYFYQRGQEYKPDLYLKDSSGKNKLVVGTDYVAPAYSNYDKPSTSTTKGTAVIEVKDGGNYKPRTITVTYNIQTNDISTYTRSLSDLPYTPTPQDSTDTSRIYTAKAIKEMVESGTASISLMMGAKTLKYGSSESDTTADYIILTNADDTEFAAYQTEHGAQSLNGDNNAPSYASNVETSVNYIWVKGINAYSGFRKVPFNIILNLNETAVVKVYTDKDSYDLDADGKATVNAVIKYKGINSDTFNTTLTGDNCTVTRAREGRPGPDGNITVTAKENSACIGKATNVYYEGSTTAPKFLADLGTYKGISIKGGTTYAYTGDPIEIKFNGIESDAEGTETVLNTQDGDYCLIYTQDPSDISTQRDHTTAGKWYAILRAQDNSKYFKKDSVSNSEAVKERYAFNIKYYLSDAVMTFKNGNRVGHTGSTINVYPIIKTADGAVTLYDENTTNLVDVSPLQVTDMGTYDIVAKAKSGQDLVADTGNKIGKFTVDGVALEEDKVLFAENNSNTITYTYKGSAYTPEMDVRVTSRSGALTKNVDYTVEYKNNIDAGTATVTVTGIHNYSGTVTKTFTINKKNIADSDIKVEVEECHYVGTKDKDGQNLGIKLEPKVTVTYGTMKLTEGVDYEKITSASYSSNDSIATEVLQRESQNTDVSPNVSITAKAGSKNYYGSKTPPVNFTINKLDISNNTNVAISPNTVEYTGEILHPEEIIKLTVPYGDKEAVLELYNETTGKGDYTISVVDSSGQTATIQNMDVYTLIIEGKNSCTGKVTMSFTVTQRSLADNYHYYYQDNDEKGIWTYNKNLFGTGKPGFTTEGGLTGDSLKIKIADVTSVAENGDNRPDEAGIIIIDNEVTDPDTSEKYQLVEGKDYTVSVTNARTAGTGEWSRAATADKHAKVATTSPAITITGMGDYKDSITLPFNIGININTLEPDIYYYATNADLVNNKCHYIPGEEELDKWHYTYNGEPQIPDVSVYIGTSPLSLKNYTVTYTNEKNEEDESIDAGYKYVVITGKGDYCGIIKQRYAINRKALLDSGGPYLKDPMETENKQLSFEITGSEVSKLSENVISDLFIKQGIFKNPNDPKKETFKNMYYAVYDGVDIKPTVRVTDHTLGPSGKTSYEIKASDLDIQYERYNKVAEFNYDQNGMITNCVLAEIHVQFRTPSPDAANPDKTFGNGNYYVGQGGSNDYVIQYMIIKHNIEDDFSIQVLNGLNNDHTSFADGKQKTLDIRVTNGSRDLVEGTDYTVSYKDDDGKLTNVVPGKATLRVKGTGNYTGEKTKEFYIDGDLSLTTPYYESNNVLVPGIPLQTDPGVPITCGNPEIKLVLTRRGYMTEDIVLSYDQQYNIVDTPTSDDDFTTDGTVIYSGIPSKYWTGKKEINYSIQFTPANVKIINKKDSYEYTGYPIVPKLELNVSTAEFDKSDAKFYRNDDKTKETSDFTTPGKITIDLPYIIGGRSYTLSESYQITKRSLTSCKVVISQEQRYTGRVVKPAYTIYVDSKNLETGKSQIYTIPKSEINTEYGNYKTGTACILRIDAVEGSEFFKNSTYATYNIVLSEVANLRVDEKTGTDLTVQWDNDLYADGAELKLEKLDSTGKYVEIELSAAGSQYYPYHRVAKTDGSSFVITGLDSSTQYRVSARSYSSAIAPSNWQTIITNTQVKDESIDVVSNSPGTATVEFSDPGSVTLYYIYRCNTNSSIDDDPGKLVAIIPASTGRYTNSGLSSGTYYYYVIGKYLHNATLTEVGRSSKVKVVVE